MPEVLLGQAAAQTFRGRSSLMNSSRMRVLWISCLLLGSTICAPVEKGEQPLWSQSGYQSEGTGPSSSSSSSYHSGLRRPRSSQASGPSSTDVNVAQKSHPVLLQHQSVGQYGAPAGYMVGQYGTQVYPGGYAVGHHGASAAYPGGYVAPGVGTPGYVSQYPAAPAHVDSASGTSGEENEPVFSDVSNMEPTYSSSFRSRYQKGGAVMVQTRYIPTEAHGLSVPVFPYTSYMFASQGYPYTPVKTAY